MAVTREGVYASLANLNRWQVQRCIDLAADDTDDGISGSTVLAIMVKETNARNVVGGGVFQRQADGRVRCVDRCGEDRGAMQINEHYHEQFLRSVPGCRSGLWKPDPGHLAIEVGYVPQLSPMVSYAIGLLAGNVQYAIANGVKSGERVRFAIAAYNAGRGGALQGYRQGNVDARTTGSNYSAVVLEIRFHVQAWLVEKGLATR